MDAWVFWVILAVVLAVGEVVSLSFFLAPFAVGAIAAALLDAAGVGAGASSRRSWPAPCCSWRSSVRSRGAT
jgi:hypothetical protein